MDVLIPIEKRNNEVTNYAIAKRFVETCDENTSEYEDIMYMDYVCTYMFSEKWKLFVEIYLWYLKSGWFFTILYTFLINLIHILYIKLISCRQLGEF